MRIELLYDRYVFGASPIREALKGLTSFLLVEQAGNPDSTPTSYRLARRAGLSNSVRICQTMQIGIDTLRPDKVMNVGMCRTNTAR